MRSDAEIDAETALRDAKTNLENKGGTRYERDYAQAAREYEAVTGLDPSKVQGY